MSMFHSWSQVSKIIRFVYLLKTWIKSKLKPKSLPCLLSRTSEFHCWKSSHQCGKASGSQSDPADPCALTSTDSSTKLQPANPNLTRSRNCTVRYSPKCRELGLHRNGYLDRVFVFWNSSIGYLTCSVFVLLRMPQQHNHDSDNYKS